MRKKLTFKTPDLIFRSHWFITLVLTASIPLVWFNEQGIGLRLKKTKALSFELRLIKWNESYPGVVWTAVCRRESLTPRGVHSNVRGFLHQVVL